MRGCTGCEIADRCWAVRLCWRMARNPKTSCHYQGLTTKRFCQKDWPGPLANDGDPCRIVWTGRIRTYPEVFDAPFRAKQSQVIFVCPQGDLAHADEETVKTVFEVILEATQHQFVLLTKWPALLMRKLQTAYATVAAPSLWLGISLTSQETAEERVSALRELWPGNKIVSAEPLLGPLDLTKWLPKLAWVISASENNGTRGQVYTPDIRRDLRDQCFEASVPWWDKQCIGPTNRVEVGPRLDGVRHMGCPVAIKQILTASGKLPVDKGLARE